VSVTTQAVVVGAGPAGSAAALVLARAGFEVILLERGPYPGSKNVYGGVVYGRILDELIPQWWENAPIQRWITRRSTMVLTDSQALSVDFRTQHWKRQPFNGATAYRSEFDPWLAHQAEKDGAKLLCSTTAVGLLKENGKVVGVRTDRPNGDLYAKLVVACDGVNSLLAKEAGLYEDLDESNFTLGVKEVWHLGKKEIDSRFGLSTNEGVDIEILGGTSPIAGGGFIYTNLDTLAIGAVLRLTDLAASRKRPEEIVAKLRSHPAIAPWFIGSHLVEYSAHLIPEGGYHSMPRLVADGLLVAGDAAGMCLATGVWLEGINYAIGSGAIAGKVAAAALARGDYSSSMLSKYESELHHSFVMKNHKRLRHLPHLVLSERLQSRYPQVLCNVVDNMFTVRDPLPKPRLSQLVRAELKKAGVRGTEVLADLLSILRDLQ